MSDQAATDGADPRSAAVTFATTEHFVLQGARSATIAESNGRTNMFLAAVSGGLVALGLVATASSLGSAFYGFALVLLPTLAFVGFVTFERTLAGNGGDGPEEREADQHRSQRVPHSPRLSTTAGEGCEKPAWGAAGRRGSDVVDVVLPLTEGWIVPGCCSLARISVIDPS